MPRAITLFTGQWVDMPLQTLSEKTASWGFDCLDLACRGDHFDVRKVPEERYAHEKEAA